MEDKPKGSIFSKQQLEVVNYEGDVSYGNQGKTLDRLTAKNHSLPHDDPLYGKPLRMTIFNPDLRSFLCSKEIGFGFFADVEERERPDKPEYGPDRTIVQVYIDGKPISQKKQGGGGGYQRRSLEDDLALEAVKRRSIEGQTAIAQVGTVLTCPTPVPGEDLGIDEEGWKRILGKYWQAVEKSLDNFLADPPKPVQKPQDKQGTREKTETVSKDAPPVTDPIKHVGDLLTRSLKLKPPVTRDELCVGLSINDPKEIKDLEAAWKTVQGLSATKAKQPDLPF